MARHPQLSLLQKRSCRLQIKIVARGAKNGEIPVFGAFIVELCCYGGRNMNKSSENIIVNHHILW